MPAIGAMAIVTPGFYTGGPDVRPVGTASWSSFAPFGLNQPRIDLWIMSRFG
jgi:hypothetical protein